MNANATDQTLDTISAEQNIQSWFNRLSPFDDANIPVANEVVEDTPAYPEQRIRDTFQA